jgi:sialate O-acetylesterase
VPGFSAVAYAFGKELRKSLNVPIGLISTNYGGTPAEAWTRKEVLEADPILIENLTRQSAAERSYAAQLLQYPQALAASRAAAERARQEGRPAPRPAQPPQDPAKSPNRPSGLYNAMIAPLIPYAIRGAIWYQGESNAGRAWEYRKLFPTMIRNWRDDWKQGDFPFLFVQLAPFMKVEEQPGDSAWAELREAQLLTLKAEPNTGMAVITDLGDEKDIHPKRKTEVGRRLALAARALAHREKVVYSGPVCEYMRVTSDGILLRFKHVGSGLESRDGALTGFTITGEDHKFVNAEAKTVGKETVLVSSPAVAKPVAVRFGWANFPVVNLYNSAGLPATPFRTDDFPMITAPKR